MIKALEIKTSMLFDLDFANNTILSCFFLFLNYWLIIFNSCSYCTNFYPVVELVILIGIPTTEAKAEMEANPVILEVTISKWAI